MAGTFKRVSAFFIDLFIISIMVNLCTLFINPNNIDDLIEEQSLIIEKIVDNEIDLKTGIDSLVPISYKIDKNNVTTNLISMIIIVGYLGIYQYYSCQSIGKKILKIKIKGINLSLNKMVLRSVLIYGIIFTLMNIISIYIFNEFDYFYISIVTNFIEIIFILTCLFMVLFREDKKGLHDLILKTEVVEV